MPGPKGQSLHRSLQGHKCPCSLLNKCPCKDSDSGCHSSENLMRRPRSPPAPQLLNRPNPPTMEENVCRKGLSLKRCQRKRFIPITPQCRLSAPAGTTSRPGRPTRATFTWKFARLATHSLRASSGWSIPPDASSGSAVSMPSPTKRRQQQQQPSNCRSSNRLARLGLRYGGGPTSFGNKQERGL